jgi:hypothetical protein
MTEPDLYFSVDTETDGPIPGPFSMVSIGVACIGSFDGEHFERRDPAWHTFYAELKPISDQCDLQALAVSGLSRDDLVRYGRDPHAAMSELAAWVRRLAVGYKAVFVAYPLGFDWMFTYWYFVNFAGDNPLAANSPFGFSNALDIKSMYATMAGAPIGLSTKRSMPRHLFSRTRHTHNALDDAIEQGELFCNLMSWPCRSRPAR